MTNLKEIDPHGKEKQEPGAKLDAGKAPVFRGAMQYFPRALRAIAILSAKGAAKYSWKGWECVPDGPNRYGDALARHILEETISGPIDTDTDVLHATAEAWNSMARLELILRESDRIC
jgi:hypothetical protein